jgi:hypothetical protein
MAAIILLVLRLGLLSVDICYIFLLYSCWGIGLVSAYKASHKISWECAFPAENFSVAGRLPAIPFTGLHNQVSDLLSSITGYSNASFLDQNLTDKKL